MVSRETPSSRRDRGALVRLARDVIPIAIVIAATLRRLSAILGQEHNGLLLVLAIASLLSAAFALSNVHRGQYVRWDSCSARPVRMMCVLMVGGAWSMPPAVLTGSRANWLLMSFETRGWICGLGAALAVVVLIALHGEISRRTSSVGTSGG